MKVGWVLDPVVKLIPKNQHSPFNQHHLASKLRQPQKILNFQCSNWAQVGSEMEMFKCISEDCNDFISVSSEVVLLREQLGDAAGYLTEVKQEKQHIESKAAKLVC